MKTKEELLKTLNYRDDEAEMTRSREYIEIIAEALIDIRDVLARTATVIEGIEDHMARDRGRR